MNWNQAGNKVLDQLEQAGFESYIVGGAVRDKFISKVADDVDIATRASIKEIQSIFRRTIEVGVQHGTILVLVSNFPVQVSTFKGESIEEDLLQRDFTINALAQNSEGEIIDPFQGREDLQKQLIRTIDASNKPFINDPLRLLRALRFALQLEFKIETKTQRTMNDLSKLIEQPSIERVVQELEKVSKCQINGEQWKWLFNQMVFNELPHLFQSVDLKQSLQNLDEAISFNDELTWWSFALYDTNPIEVKRALKIYKRSNKLKKDVMEIHEKVILFTHESWTLFDLYKLGEHRLTVALNLLSHLLDNGIDDSKWLDTYDQLQMKQKKDLNVTGNDILAQNPKLPGWRVGDLIKKAETAVVNGQIKNEKQIIMHWLERES